MITNDIPGFDKWKETQWYKCVNTEIFMIRDYVANLLAGGNPGFTFYTLPV